MEWVFNKNAIGCEQINIVVLLHGHCKAVTLTVPSRHRSTANQCNLVLKTAVVQGTVCQDILEFGVREFDN